MGRTLKKSSSRPVVLDTSALLYWTLLPGSLSGPARAAIETASEGLGCFVSAISLWEIALKAKRGQLTLAALVEQR